jgi:hypothetical protein
LLDFLGGGETLSSEGIAAEEPPPAFLQIQPASSRGNEDMVQAWMLSEPSSRLSAVMAAEIVGDEEDISRGIIGLDVLKQCNIMGGVA